MAELADADTLLKITEAVRAYQAGDYDMALHWLKGLPGSLAAQLVVCAIREREHEIQQQIDDTGPADENRLKTLHEQRQRLLQEALEALHFLTEQLTKPDLWSTVEDPQLEALTEQLRDHIIVPLAAKVFFEAAQQSAKALALDGVTAEIAISDINVSPTGEIQLAMRSDGSTTEDAPVPVKSRVTIRHDNTADKPVVHLEHVDESLQADDAEVVDARRLHHLATAIIAARQLAAGRANIEHRLNNLRQPTTPAICLKTNLGAHHLNALCQHPDLRAMGISEQVFFANRGPSEPLSCRAAHAMFTQQPSSKYDNDNAPPVILGY